MMRVEKFGHSIRDNIGRLLGIGSAARLFYGFGHRPLDDVAIGPEEFPRPCSMVSSDGRATSARDLRSAEKLAGAHGSIILWFTKEFLRRSDRRGGALRQYLKRFQDYLRSSLTMESTANTVKLDGQQSRLRYRADLNGASQAPTASHSFLPIDHQGNVDHYLATSSRSTRTLNPLGRHHDMLLRTSSGSDKR